MAIKEIRQKRGMKQVELAKAMNVGQSAIAMWETGAAHPRADKLPELARILDCTVDELLRPAETEETARFNIPVSKKEV